MPNLYDNPAPHCGDLQEELAPSKEEILARINSWVICDLRNTIKSNVRYENKLYGVWDDFLRDIFVIRRRFSVKPQPVMQPVIEDNDSDTSIGSTGGNHQSRETHGVEQRKKYPDFAVYKTKVQNDAESVRFMLTIVEIKRDRHSLTEGHFQMKGYLAEAALHPNREAHLNAYLLCGNILRRYWLINNEIHYNHLEAADIFEDPATSGCDLAEELSELAMNQWN